MTFPGRPMRRLILVIGLATLVVGCGHLRERRPREHASAQVLRGDTARKVSHRQKADLLVAMGRTLEAGKQPNQAETAYLDALKNDSRRADAHARLAVLLDQRGEFQGSAEHFAAAARLAPNDPDIPCDQGYSLYLQRRWADAERKLHAAIALDSRHARSHMNLGLVLARQGDDRHALDEFARAGCDRADAQANLGLILASEGRFADAQTAYAAAIAAKPASAGARDGLRAVTLAQADKTRPAVAVRPTSPVDSAVSRASVELPPLP